MVSVTDISDPLGVKDDFKPDITVFQEICDTIARQVPCDISIMSQGGIVVASSIIGRNGQVHQGARKILCGELDKYEVDAEMAAQGPVMREGCNLPIELSGKRIASVGIAAPLAEARNYTAIVQTCIQVMLHEHLNSWIHKHTLITRINDATQALSESEARLKNIIQSSSDWIWITDEKLKFTFLSDRFFEISQLPKTAILGKTREQFAGQENNPINSQKWSQHLLDLESRLAIKEFEYCALKQSGERFWMKISGSPYYHADGSFGGYQGTGTDYTELKAAQDLLIRNEKIAALGGLVAGVAHELNTPIGSAITAVSHFEEQCFSAEKHANENTLTRSYLADFLNSSVEISALIHSNLKRASGLVNNLKEIAMDRDVGPIRCFNLHDYIEEVSRDLETQLQQRHIVLSVSCPASIEIMSIPGAIYQIIYNLLKNSLDHGFTGTRGRIDLEVIEQQENIVLNYSDSGIGMSAHELSRIFEPFYTTARGSGNTGLGMFLAHNLATKTLQGSITAASAPGQGLSFQIKLPKSLAPE
ncbi:MAG: ATP-binding protein [Motiliproteus sp.]